MVEAMNRRLRTPARAATWLLLGLLIGVLLPLGSGGCASRRDAKARERAPELHVGQGREDSLHCRKGRCSNWYRLVIENRAAVIVEANAPADPALPDFYLSLQDRELRPIADERVLLERPRRIQRELAPGLYWVRVVGAQKKDDLLSYKISVKRPRASSPPPRKPGGTHRQDPPPPPPPPPPPAQKPKLIKSEVIEVERQGGEPVAVLLEAGTGHGMKPGMRGELVDGGQVIGRLEVIDVYADGSRAKIIGGLSAPITLDTEAQIGK